MKIGWADHELIWLEAANTLPRAERYEALQDIASMSGRSFGAVYQQAYRMRTTQEALAKLRLNQRRVA